MVWNQQLIETIELQNMILSAKSVTMASLNRDFSLGGHVRLDGKRKKYFQTFFNSCFMNMSGRLNSEKN